MYLHSKENVRCRFVQQKYEQEKKEDLLLLVRDIVGHLMNGWREEESKMKLCFLMCPAQFLKFSQADFNESVQPHFRQRLCEYSCCPLTLRIRLRIINMQNTNNYKHADDFAL